MPHTDHRSEYKNSLLVCLGVDAGSHLAWLDWREALLTGGPIKIANPRVQAVRTADGRMRRYT
jgi:hypothetical protein